MNALTGRNELDTIKRALEFVSAINRADLTALGEMTSDDHCLIDSDGSRIAGREAVLDAWRRYFSMMPSYTIAVEETYSRGTAVVLIGKATGTYSSDGRMEDRNRWSVPAAWRAVVKGNRIATWQLFVNPEPVLRIIRGKGAE